MNSEKSPKMSKKDLVKNISQSVHISEHAAEEAIAKTFDFIANALRNEKKVSIYGFGTFRVVKKESERKAEKSEQIIFEPSPELKK
jgi:nucleoid DNA-binding protein